MVLLKLLPCWVNSSHNHKVFTDLKNTGIAFIQESNIMGDEQAVKFKKGE